jgi:hypothetical protein
MRRCALLLSILISLPGLAVAAIPLPEHPRPDFERAEWVNLNGEWRFQFDRGDAGQRERWFERAPDTFPLTIRVPYPWGSTLSGVPDEAEIAWYARTVRVPAEWTGKRVFLVVGASDWKTEAWLDGAPLGSHQGGYTPFEMELSNAKPGTDQTVVLRVDDVARTFKLEGKQGYGNARGVWQTVYLEARPAAHVDSIEMHPSLAKKHVQIVVRLSTPGAAGDRVDVAITAPGDTGAKPVSVATTQQPIAAGAREVRLTVPLGERARAWSLDDPFLYDATVTLTSKGGADHVKTYFGLRDIGTANVPGLGPYVTLNGQPVYLQMTLDQSWNADGFWNWATDEAMREEILIARRLGLNTIRTHVKIEVPRKLYWADRLGVLVMADVPNSWGEPDEPMRGDWEHALRGMVRRDFNHPSIFSWVLFNEQWGLLSNDPSGALNAEGKPRRIVLPATLDWVESRYEMAKKLDPTRLIEDNSPCCGGGHVKSDLNTWHMYLPGWRWKETLDEAETKTFAGSNWNYVGGRVQGTAPMMNSECGNVWGYEGSTGDVDWSYDYHAMMDEFRRHPKVAGWLYTEHHDVVNEWNGYVRADRSEKETGLGELAPGMSVRDWHAPFYIAIGEYPMTSAKPGQTVSVPVWASLLAGASASQTLTLAMELVGYDDLGRFREWWKGTRAVPFAPWTSRALEPVKVTMPERRSVAVLRARLEDATGRVLHRNFTSFAVGEGTSPRDERVQVEGSVLRVLRAAATSPSAASWSGRSWTAIGGRKQNGSGSGSFEYRMSWPKDMRVDQVAGASIVAELGAKQLFGKDRVGAGQVEGDFMRGKGTHDPSLNRNAYPMTDGVTYPSAVRVSVNGVAVGTFDLPDDPADHRGLLSWHAQVRSEKPVLDEAGSYGYLVSAAIPDAALKAAAASGEIVIRFEVPDALPGGLAVYGEGAGRYPLDPSLLISLK